MAKIKKLRMGRHIFLNNKIVIDFRLKLYWKLFVVMGVSWIFDLASWAYPGTNIAKHVFPIVKF